MTLEIIELSKKFGDTAALDGVSFCADSGKVLTVIGDSGSGKSTLLKLLDHIEQKDSGRIILDGKELYRGKDDVFSDRLNFGLVFQNFNLFYPYSAYENIMIPVRSMVKREIKTRGVPLSRRKKETAAALAEREKSVRRLIERLNISKIKDQYPISLSGGEAQRVAIARALATDPAVICFDEPTSALDNKLVGEVAEIITSLRELDKIIIVVTHDISLAKKISDNVIFMKNGRIIESGDAGILDDPKTEELNDFLK